MKTLPNGRSKQDEERAFLNVCHRTQNRRPRAEEVLIEESFFDASARPEEDVWAAFYKKVWNGPTGELNGAQICSAIRDHLAGVQGHDCCYCGQALLG
ncbi:MAG TPA: hypothetical protein VLG41_00005 [Hydrogenophaga sp.]|uniref:hypothetical protein n=1 Tax=Hydrogenophaga sp. TaxID=1904254 RepID=UPI002B62B120|nr:hypothetical protein [Hydrogenophaga sp.]HSX91270.1 hypothetical protein [Hydrogenophaga sp.]